jgi:hypothetical protein
MLRKQAVLLIHGIGEQLPMDTLRKFVETVWIDDTSLRREFVPSTIWSKPDNVSQSFELRRLTTAQNRTGTRTDFFELYWAHLMHGTTLNHVFAWIRLLLMRYPWTIPPQLRGIYFLMLAGILLSIVLAANAMLPDAQKIVTLPWWLSVSMSIIIIPFIAYVLKKILGDAARYLHPAPENIQRRHEIRTAGLAILRELHRKERNYERIILVGHSLGSVIGYDILTHGWAMFHDRYSKRPTVHKALEELEALAPATSIDGQEDCEASRIQEAQRRYRDELRANGNEWRVTDFVTLGSPLAHAEILLAKNKAELKTKQDNREFPTCLPITEMDDGRRRFSFFKDGMRFSHHAAVFASTRWTNIYFPAVSAIFGDVIGGPLSRVFGKGILDLPVKTREWWGLFSHTLYWHYRPSKQVPPHIAVLRYALNLADDSQRMKLEDLKKLCSK